MDFVIIALLMGKGILILSEIYQIQKDQACIITKLNELKKQITDKK